MPSPNCDNNALRTAIVQRLLDLVEQGITDPNELRNATLSHFDAGASA
jgi:hypothetical protein